MSLSRLRKLAIQLSMLGDVNCRQSRDMALCPGETKSVSDDLSSEHASSTEDTSERDSLEVAERWSKLGKQTPFEETVVWPGLINGDSSLSRPKSEPEPFSKTKMDLEHIPSRPKSVEVEPSAVKSPREHGPSEVSFDDVLPTSENLTHPTASRPKMPGKRPPGRFNGLHSPQNKDLTENQKVHHEQEEESAKPLTPEVKKPLVTAATAPIFSPLSIVCKPNLVSLSPVAADFKPKLDLVDGRKNEVEELRAQISELLTIVDALRKEHRYPGLGVILHCMM
ncbi:CD2-associated protein-like [Bufo bufo]|uniref:CD2-associated protein-like n=1 Tax=Bufo bufo TaxID=8384 RepID=UPI001ABEA8FD|nr:CD2-associated protein-like [Bufo bufo]